MKKKIISALMVCASVIFMLSGCGSSKGADTKLIIWTNMDVETDTIQKYADEWGR